MNGYLSVFVEITKYDGMALDKYDKLLKFAKKLDLNLKDIDK